MQFPGLKMKQKKNIFLVWEYSSCSWLNLYLIEVNMKQEVKAVNTREPENNAELRSFLGLNYNVRYIPNFANVAYPLQKLTRKMQPFIFSQEKTKVFDTLEKHLTIAVTLGYFAS